jgi:hypothetical protein
MLSAKEIECLLACNECAAACLQCASACLKEDDPKPMARCIALDYECADICRLAADSMALGGSKCKPSAHFAPMPVKLAQRNAVSMPWTTAKPVRRRANVAPSCAGQWPNPSAPEIEPPAYLDIS